MVFVYTSNLQKTINFPQKLLFALIINVFSVDKIAVMQ